ncbi:putative integral membrane protein [Streptomyces sp. L-9-10]|uniref:hypothetical protein n=1 Tax=Streptomyces sp. L-9-10 TaxID=1478131 RepID=UPI00101B5AC4|nr:hypothetical protein [Streptomyces sp. L-9-10]RYJ24000.1 putative integral membrane protein [Streptomyces sp. L-9-10]
MISTAIRLARVGSGSELAAALLLVLSFPCVMLAAIIPNIWFFAAAAAVTYLADTFLHQRGSYLVNRLAKVRAGLSIRFLIRQMLLVLLVARSGLGEDRIFYVTVVAVLVFYGLQAPHGAIVTLLRLRRRLPVVTRNIDLGAIRIPDAPPRWLLSRSAEKMLHLDLFAMVGVIITLQTRDNLYGFAGLGLSVLLAVGYILALLPYLRPSRLVPNAEKVLKAVDGWLADYRPTVMLYFSGSKESAYQVNMWLETMGQLNGRPLIVLRERVIAQQLGPTAVPVLCVPGGVHLMNLDLSTVRVALYAANVGKNIHMLRVPTMKHVFIGHGDSDKLASVNPYSKAYDEVWTAGRAGRDRYALADVGVRDEDIVEVGRPQLAPIEPASGSTRNPVPTVLYAPTWEGWDDSPGNTSLLLAGENIVKRLLKAERPVRVLYKPHPFTGTRSAKAKAVHERIIALVGKAAAERATDARWAEDAAGLREEQNAARTELARLGARLTELSGGADASRDEAEESRDSKADPARQAELTRLRREWNGAYWRSFGWWEHRVISGSEPALYDCFNESDAMVSDISSVVSDFIASGKPYAVTDSAELGAEEFKRQNTAVRAAVILSNSAKELDQLLAAVTDPSADPLAEARRELKRYLLGPDEPTSIEQFDAATRALAAKSLARNVGVEQRLAEPEAAPAPDDSAPSEPRAEDSPVGG